MIKTNNEGEEVFVLPFSALDDEYLFWKYRLTRLKSEVIYSGKDLIWFNDKKKKDGKPKISGLLTKNLKKRRLKTINTLNAPCRKYVETM